MDLIIQLKYYIAKTYEISKIRIIIIRHSVSAYILKTTFKNNISLKRSFLLTLVKKFHHIRSLIIEWIDIFFPNIPEVFTN